MSILPGFAEKGDDGDEAAGVLTASMYGTAVAGRAAGRKLAKDLQDNLGCIRGPYDRAVYRKEEGDNRTGSRYPASWTTWWSPTMGAC